MNHRTVSPLVRGILAMASEILSVPHTLDTPRIYQNHVRINQNRTRINSESSLSRLCRVSAGFLLRLGGFWAWFWGILGGLWVRARRD